jgi:hypothetical protein
MSPSKIKCPDCKQWNTASGETDQVCTYCEARLHNRQTNGTHKGTNDGFSFISSLPPYAQYIFLGIVAIIGGIVVIALA